MAYYSDITAGRGGLALYNESIGRMRDIHAGLQSTLANFNTNMTSMGLSLENRQMQQDALKYQKGRDALNDSFKERQLNAQEAQAKAQNDLSQQGMDLKRQSLGLESQINTHRANLLKAQQAQIKEQTRSANLANNFESKLQRHFDKLNNTRTQINSHAPIKPRLGISRGFSNQ